MREDGVLILEGCGCGGEWIPEPEVLRIAAIGVNPGEGFEDVVGAFLSILHASQLKKL